MDLATVGFTTTLTFLSALLFSVLGLGGSAGYLAIFSLLSVPAQTMSTSVLLINVLVTGISVRTFLQAGHKPMPVIYPFLVTSIPAAVLGGSLHVKEGTYFVLLALALAAAAIGVAVSPAGEADPKRSQPALRTPAQLVLPLAAGAVLGLIAGVVGIGGGVLLSPMLILLRWDSVKRISATTATFSFINSVSGLTGRCLSGATDFTFVTPLVVAACAGALIGSQLGARIFSPATLRRVLAVLLAGVAVRLVIVSSDGHFGARGKIALAGHRTADQRDRDSKSRLPSHNGGADLLKSNLDLMKSSTDLIKSNTIEPTF